MMRKFAPFFFTPLILFMMVACNTGSNENGSQAGRNQADLVLLGETVYAQACAGCHGLNLEGQAQWQVRNADGTFRAPPLDGSGHAWHHGDRHLRERILYGNAVLPAEMRAQSVMPAFEGMLADAEVEALIAYMKSIWPEEARAAQAQATAQEANQ